MIFSSQILLTHYDPSILTILLADTSAFGHGVVISHQFPDVAEKSVMYVSHTLTPAEKKFDQMEKASLALVLAVRRSHKFLYSQRFTLPTVHKLLHTIFGSKFDVSTMSLDTFGLRR